MLARVSNGAESLFSYDIHNVFLGKRTNMVYNHENENF